MQHKRLRFLPYLLFPIFFAFASISNIFDWDHFLSSSESDLRSWMIWHEAPVWSYQFCGGVTRIGDPQAFGLSPFFIFNLLFGSLWGWKIFLVVSSMVAVFYLEKIRKEFFAQAPETVARILIYGYVFGNSFLWAFHHGHMTFILHYWVLALIYYYLRATAGGRFTLKDYLLSAAIAYGIFSAGFYHTAVFFGLPLAISCVIHLGWGLWRKTLKTRPMAGFMLAMLTGLLFSTYKWLEVLKYQLVNPRTVSSVEVTQPLEILKNLFLPTYNYHFLGIFNSAGPWSIWEYSAFSISTWIFAVAFFSAPQKIFAKMKTPTYAAVFPMIFAIVSLVFYVGGDSKFYPFYAINHYLLHDSVRVVGRFGHDLVLALMLLALVYLPQTQPKFLKFLKSPAVFVGCFILIALNFLSFWPTLYVPYWPGQITALPGNPDAKMSEVFITRTRSDRQSFMYEPVAAGVAVLNCYNPIERPTYVSAEAGIFPQKEQGKLFPFVEFKSGPSKECLEGTYYTANHVVIGQGCPKACLSFNDVNPVDRSAFALDPLKRIYCTK